MSDVTEIINKTSPKLKYDYVKGVSRRNKIRPCAELLDEAWDCYYGIVTEEGIIPLSDTTDLEHEDTLIDYPFGDDDISNAEDFRKIGWEVILKGRS